MSFTNVVDMNEIPANAHWKRIYARVLGDVNIVPVETRASLTLTLIDAYYWDSKSSGRQG